MEKVIKLCKEIKRSGGRAYIVGGWVRDKIMNLSSKDIDIEVFGISPSTLETILPKVGKWRRVGSFEIYLLDNAYDISFPRGNDGKVDVNLSIKEASKRRDLTINSIYYDPLEDRYFDFNSGIKHIEERYLDYITEEEFLKDSLRILRVISILARNRGFRVSSRLIETMKNHSFQLAEIKKERIFIELEKLLLKGNNIVEAFKLAELCRIDEFIFNEGFVLNSKYLKYEGRSIEVSLALLLMGNLDVTKALDRITEEVQLKKDVINLIRHYGEFEGLLDKIGSKRVEVKKLAVETDMKKLATMYKAINNTYPNDLIDIYDEIKGQLKPWIKGRDLLKIGLKANEEFGIILKELYRLQLEEKFESKEELMEYAKKTIGLDK